ncbi:SWR1 complex subunit vps71 [Talaromyces pinophilus]|nr:SWR1 complex subunit vps71 [Talaromyces pinophilus]
MMLRPAISSLRAGRVLATSQAPAMFSTSSHLRTDISSSALPKQRPVGAFRGGLFGFLLGSVAAGVSVYYYILKEYRVSNELLTEDIYLSSTSPHNPNFDTKMPLVEVLGTSRSHATPGWAYVPETALQKSSTTLTTSRKRGIREPGRTGTDLTSRQNHATIRHLAELDRENHRDNVHIPVPVRKDAIQRDNGRGARAKTTSNVRRIMQSQKTFKNYLDDEEAALAHSTATTTGGVAAVPVVVGAAAGVSKVARVAARRSLTPAFAAASSTTQDTLTERQKRALARKTTSTDTPATKKQKSERTNEEVHGDDMQIDTPEQIQEGLLKTPHDNDHLLKSYIPLPPSDRLMAALLAEPPLRYHAARAAPSATNKPARQFCTICGYWGKIKCKNCGVRTCGLECYKVHEDSRCGAFF